MSIDAAEQQQCHCVTVCVESKRWASHGHGSVRPAVSVFEVFVGWVAFNFTPH